MHILFLTDNFPPEVNAPASRTYEHCREWVKEGHQVTVITCVPNFPIGKIFDGYRNLLWQIEKMDGIHVIRVWSYIAENKGFLKRTLDYMSFMFTSIPAALFVPHVDVVIGTSPQFFTVIAAYIVSKIKRIPFIFELRDLWPESIKAVGAISNHIILKLLEKLEIFLYQKAKRIVSVTNSFKNVLAKRGIDESKIIVITNGVDMSRFKPMPKDVELLRYYGLEDKFVAGYVGTHGLAHHLETLLDAAEIIKNNQEFNMFHFILLGDGARKQFLKEEAARRGLKNVTFVDTVPKDQVQRYWSLLDVSIIHLKKTDLFETVIPSKLFECMGMGLPVIHGVAGESAEIVNKEGIGMIFEPENASQLVDCLQKMYYDRISYENYKSRCLEAAKKYDRSRLAMRMLHEAIIPAKTT